MSQGCSLSPGWQAERALGISAERVPGSAQSRAGFVIDKPSVLLTLCHAGESKYCCCTEAVGVGLARGCVPVAGQAEACSVCVVCVVIHTWSRDAAGGVKVLCETQYFREKQRKCSCLKPGFGWAGLRVCHSPGF